MAKIDQCPPWCDNNQPNGCATHMTVPGSAVTHHGGVMVKQDSCAPTPRMEIALTGVTDPDLAHIDLEPATARALADLIEALGRWEGRCEEFAEGLRKAAAIVEEEERKISASLPADYHEHVPF